ncbi:MAG TPA: M23 family metallopeptidase [Fibrobacteria bacterium]|nr:M23 family metallopeptidase [Fibrobacteria bacterium]
MDKKFRISFYPKDASQVKVVSLSRRLGILAAGVLLPLAALGVWLLVSGVLHEPSQTRAMRKKLSQENDALEDRVGKLDADLRGLRGELSRLEEQKINALMISGVEYMEGEKQHKSSSLFSFFHGLASMKTDVDASLDRARAISAYLDSTLELLRERASLVEGLPTSTPVSPEALPTREFGYSPDPFTGRKALHAGVDFSQQAGAPIFAAGGGIVADVAKDLLWGNCIRIDHGRGVETFYAHLQDLAVKRGQKVSRGQTIGTMGMTGVATGVHLHYELTVRNAKVDPMNYFLPELRLATGTQGVPAGTQGLPSGTDVPAASQGAHPGADGKAEGI